MLEKLCLRWNEFKENAITAFGSLRDDQDFSDVTLACEDGKQVEAHKMILAASSPFFSQLLKKNELHKHPHPLLLAGGFLLLSKIFLPRWKTKVRGRHLRPNFDEKQGTKFWISREEKDFLNLENREEKEKVLYKS